MSGPFANFDNDLMEKEVDRQDRIIQELRDEIEQLHAAAREVIDGQQDRHKHSSGQVFVDVGSLDALARLLPTKGTHPLTGAEPVPRPNEFDPTGRAPQSEQGTIKEYRDPLTGGLLNSIHYAVTEQDSRPTAKLCKCKGDCEGHFNCRIVWNDEALAERGMVPEKDTD